MAKINKSGISWVLGQVNKMHENGRFSFDNIVQRPLVWEQARKSELIHSIIEDYPIPPIYARRTDGKIYDVLDGKQRLTAIVEYMRDEYPLVGIDDVTLSEFSDEMVDVNGLRFSQLPEEIQEQIKGYNLQFYYFDGITDEQVRILFCKLNNGKHLSTKDKNIAYCKDIISVSEIADHDLFKEILTSKGLEARKNIPLVIKANMMLNAEFLENVSFESKDFNAEIKDMELSDDDKANLKAYLDRYLEIYNEVNNRESKKVARFVRKKMGTEVHMISLVPFIKRSIDEDISVELMAGYMKHIFCRYIGEDGKLAGDYYAVSPEYNSAAQSGSAKTANIIRRNDELQKAWDEYFHED